MNSRMAMVFGGGVAVAACVFAFLLGKNSQQPVAVTTPAAQTEAQIVERPLTALNGNAADVAAGMEAVRPKSTAGNKPRVLGQPRPVAVPAQTASAVSQQQTTPSAMAPAPKTSTPTTSTTAPVREEPTRAEIMKPDPVAKPAPARVPETVIIPAGTSISIRMGSTLSTEKNVTGDTFEATLDTPLVVNDIVLAERGAKVDGKVAEVDRSGRVKGVAKMMLELTRIQLSDGQQITLRTDPWERDAESTKKADAVKVGVGAAIGAAIGAIAGGGRGAAIGGAGGAGAGTGVVLATRGKPVQIDVETKIPFRLSTALTVTEKIR